MMTNAEKTQPLLKDPASEGTRNSTTPIIFVGLCCLMSSLASILVGYSIGVFSGAASCIAEDFNLETYEKEMVVSMLNLSAAVGTLCGGYAADAIGRQRTIGVSSIVYLLGCVAMTFTTSYNLLLIGRCVTGLSVGISLVTCPMYASELSPPKYRGFVVSIAEIAVNCGILFGYISGYAFADAKNGWRWMVGVANVPAAVLLLGVVSLPMSPRWLMMKGRFDEARVILNKICDSPEEVKLQVVALETELANADQQADWSAVLNPSAELRPILFVGLAVAFFQQATGIEAAMYYTPDILKEAGVTSRSGQLLFTVGLGLTKTACTVVAAAKVDSFGRRPMLLWGSLGLVAALVMIMFAFIIGGQPSLAITGQYAYVMFTGFSWGPICWLLLAEIFPTNVRSKATSLCVFMNRMVAYGCAASFLSTIEFMGTIGTYIMYSSIAVVATVFTFYYVPETKGKSLEEIQLYFKGRYSDDSSKYEQLAGNAAESDIVSVTSTV
eukprot:GFYU01009291.1.p1 GENE.GFYU01009291.1~~GFYU01009291.1.p1  ORF type:complete len:497 (+),score=115.11 GFYU01009291.1:84-1574(+)